MKGSPLIKTLWVAVAVTAIGMALHGHMYGGGKKGGEVMPRQGDATGGVTGNATANEPTKSNKIPFELALSARAKRVWIRQGDILIEEKITAEKPAISELRGELYDTEQVIFLEVDWLDEQAPRYFAKLRLDPPGKKALVHVFESAAKMDDLWEMP